MDFYAMKRKELQEMCKKHGVPANMKNVEMADKLTSIFKEKEDPKFKGKSCLKPLILIDDPGDESEKVARKVKKVKFSPQNETFEFEHLENEVDLRAKRTKARALRNMSIMKVDQKVKNKVNVEVSSQVTNAVLKRTSSRAQKSVLADGAVDISSPLVQKRTRRNGKSKYLDKDVVEMNSSIDCRVTGVKQGRESLDEHLAGKGEKLKIGKVVRQSTRNVTKDKSSIQLNDESGGDGDAAFEFGEGNRTDPEVLVDNEDEVILQPNVIKGRKSSRRKGAVIFNEIEKKLRKSAEEGPKMEEDTKVPDENERDSLPECNLRRSRRKTTLFKTQASVNVGLETNEAVGKNKALKQSSKRLSCEQTSENIELPCRATHNSSKHDSSGVSSEVGEVVNQKKNYTRKQRNIEPVPQEEAPIIDHVGAQDTITCQASSFVTAIESELNITDNSAIIESPTKVGADSEHQGISANNITWSFEHAETIENVPQEINVDIVEQPTMVNDIIEFGVGSEKSSFYDNQVPTEIMQGAEMFSNDEDGLHSQERTVNEVKLNGDQTNQTPGVNGDQTNQTPGCLAIDYSENFAPEEIIDNVSKAETGQHMNEVSCGDSINTNISEIDSRVVEDITSSALSRSLEKEHKEDEDLVDSESNIPVTGTSSIEQKELTCCISEMMVKNLSEAEDISAVVGSHSPGKSQDTLEEENTRLITQIEKTSLIIDTNISRDRSVEEMIYSSDGYVNTELKGVEAIETNNEKASEVRKMNKLKLSVDKKSNPLSSCDRGSHKAYVVKEILESQKNYSELFAKTEVVSGYSDGYQNLSSFNHNLLTVNRINEQGLDELEVPASHTNSSFHVTICKEDKDADEITNASSKEKLLESKLENDNLSEAMEVSLSQTAAESLVDEKIIKLNTPKVLSLKRNNQAEEFVDRNCIEDGDKEYTSRNYDGDNVGGMQGECATEHCHDVMKERNAGICLKAELVDDGDFHNAVSKVNVSASPKFEETISEGKKELEEITSVEMIQNTYPCNRTTNMLEEKNGGMLENTSPFRIYGVTYEDKVKDEGRMEDLAGERCNDIIKEINTALCLEAKLGMGTDFLNVAAQANGNVSSSSEEIICEGNNESENRITGETIQNTLPSIMTIGINTEEESFENSQIHGMGPDLLVSDYGDEYSNMYLNGLAASSDTFPGEGAHHSSGDNVKEKLDLIVVESISKGDKSTDLMMVIENDSIDSIHQHNETISINLADHKEDVRELGENNLFASKEAMLAFVEVEGRKETTRTLERGLYFGAESAVAGEFYASAQSNEMSAGDHIEVVESEAVQENINDDSVYEKTETVEKKALVTTPNLSKMDKEMDEKKSDLVAVQSIFENNESARHLLDSEEDSAHPCDEFSYIDSKDDMAQHEDQRCSLTSNELMPISNEVEGIEDTYKTVEGGFDFGDEKNISIATELDGLTQNNEGGADSHIGKVKFAEVHPRYQNVQTFENSKNIETEAQMALVKEEDTDAFFSGLELGKSNLTAASSFTDCKISIDVKTPFKGDYEVAFEKSNIPKEQKNELNNEANFGSNEENSVRNGPTDHVSPVKEGDYILMESEEKTTAKETEEEAQSSSSIVKETKECLETTISKNMGDASAMKPEMDTHSFPASPLTSFTTQENGVLEQQFESSHVFSNREINFILEKGEGCEVEALSPSKDLLPAAMGNGIEEQLHEHNHHMEEKVTNLSGTDLATLGEFMFERVETLKECSALGVPVFEKVESLKENDALVTTEECFDCKDNIEQTTAVENSFDHSALGEPVFEQVESFTENDVVIAKEECVDCKDNTEQTAAVENSSDHSALGEPVFEPVESSTENDVVIATEECFDCKDNIEQTAAVENSFDHLALGVSVFKQVESLTENEAVIATEECFSGNNNMKHAVTIENSFDHFALSKFDFEQVESLKENDAVVATENYFGFKDSTKQTAAIQNSFDHVSSDEVIPESDSMDPKVQIVTTDVLKDGANRELISKEIDLASAEGSNYISNHNAELREAIINLPAKQLNTPATKLKEIRLKSKQKTPEKKMALTSDMKENTTIKTDQKTISKSVAKRRALEDIHM